MIFSFSQGFYLFGEDYEYIRQLLAPVLETDALALEPPDRISVQYWTWRIEELAHEDVRSERPGLW